MGCGVRVMIVAVVMGRWSDFHAGGGGGGGVLWEEFTDQSVEILGCGRRAGPSLRSPGRCACS